MEQFERKLYEDKNKKLREELMYMRIHSLVIRPVITFIVELFK